MQTTKEISVFLENKPGRLANVCLALARDKVDITAMTVSEARERSVLRFVTDNLAKSRDVLKTLNIPFEEHDVVLVEMRNHTGALAQVCEQLGMEHINIDHVYVSAGAKNGKAIGVFKVSNTAKAMQVLAESPGARARREPHRRPLHALASRRRANPMR